MPCRHILLIEDETDLRETLKELLELIGFEVETAANGREGLANLETKGRPCLIMLDLMMPVMNGWQFLETLKKDPQHGQAAIPVVVVSAAADMVEIQAQYGCRSLSKPVDIDRLLGMAHEHCESC
ncbi:response regulator [Polaromonas glacialis]|uniref:response regulator n=1 Tax=Polaromonas glacialis TaxID=866564 RepID=UPI0004984B76|nr:response regulator [Polaromonas glacialis]